nr:hypothetical protein [Lactobacillus sp. ESL0228]
MARNSSERFTVIERLSCARTSTGIRHVYYCLVDLYRQTQVNKKTVPTKTLASYGIGLITN